MFSFTSTFSLCVIAVDRHQLIVGLTPSNNVAKKFLGPKDVTCIILIWLAGVQKSQNISVIFEVIIFRIWSSSPDIVQHPASNWGAPGEGSGAPGSEPHFLLLRGEKFIFQKILGPTKIKCKNKLLPPEKNAIKNYLQISSKGPSSYLCDNPK